MHVIVEAELERIIDLEPVDGMSADMAATLVSFAIVLDSMYRPFMSPNAFHQIIYVFINESAYRLAISLTAFYV